VALAALAANQRLAELVDRLDLVMGYRELTQAGVRELGAVGLDARIGGSGLSHDRRAGGGWHVARKSRQAGNAWPRVLAPGPRAAVALTQQLTVGRCT
jgi:hypothetical protein